MRFEIDCYIYELNRFCDFDATRDYARHESSILICYRGYLFSVPMRYIEDNKIGVNTLKKKIRDYVGRGCCDAEF